MAAYVHRADNAQFLFGELLRTRDAFTAASADLADADAAAVQTEATRNQAIHSATGFIDTETTATPSLDHRASCKLLRTAEHACCALDTEICKMEKFCDPCVSGDPLGGSKGIDGGDRGACDGGGARARAASCSEGVVSAGHASDEDPLAAWSACAESARSAIVRGRFVLDALDTAAVLRREAIRSLSDTSLRASLFDAVYALDLGLLNVGLVLRAAEREAASTAVGLDGLLMHAVEPKSKPNDGRAAIVTRLLAEEEVAATAGCADGDNFTALMVAAHDGNAECIAALLREPRVAATAGGTNSDGLTPLMIAAYSGRAAATRVLLTCPQVRATAGTTAGASWNVFGGDPTAVQVAGQTALQIAVHTGRAETVSVLLECPQALERTGFRELAHAVELGHKKTLAALLTCESILSSAGGVNEHGDTLLLLLSRTASFSFAPHIKALLAVPQIRRTLGAFDSYLGNTVLMWEAMYGHADTVAALLSCEEGAATAGFVNKEGNTALMFAAASGSSATVAAMLACKEGAATAGFMNAKKETALMLAASDTTADTEAQVFATVIALLACDRVVAYVLDAKGCSAGDHAFRFGRFEMADMLHRRAEEEMAALCPRGHTPPPLP
jgi:ankyrin repeat protein